MTTVKQLIEALQKLPEDTIVKVLVRDDSGGYETSIKWIDFELSYWKETGEICCNGLEYCDFSTNQFIKDDDPRKQLKILYIGEE